MGVLYLKHLCILVSITREISKPMQAKEVNAPVFSYQYLYIFVGNSQ